MSTRDAKFQLIVAFAAVYLLWGSTYLAIRYAIETMPPLLMAGVRFLAGGSLFWVWARIKGNAAPTARQWGWAALTGVLMLGLGGGGVHWAEQYVPSGLVALLVTSVPMFIVLIDWLRPGGVRPTWMVALGLIIGFGGIVLLIGPDKTAIDPSGYIVGSIIVLVGSFAWSLGSVISRYVDLPTSQIQATAMKLYAGGVFLIGFGFIAGDWNKVEFGAISLSSLVALIYLIVLGSVAFAAYNWLLKASTPAKASTYAYVNPVVAVFLGILLAGEPFTLRIALAMAVIIAAVVIIINHRVQKHSELEDRNGASTAKAEIPARNGGQRSHKTDLIPKGDRRKIA